MHPTTKSTLKLLTRMKSLRLKEKSITCQTIKDSKGNSKRTQEQLPFQNDDERSGFSDSIPATSSWTR